MGFEENRSISDRESASGKENIADRVRRFAALACVILLAGLYLVTFVLALLGNEKSTGLLRFCFGMTIFVPLFIWVVTWCVGTLFHKKTIASVDLLNSDPEERQKMEEAVARQMEVDERDRGK
jgi:hypothetical protein